MELLPDLLAGRRDDVELDRAALELATIEYPSLDIQPFLELLDSHAAELAGRLHPGIVGADFLLATNHYLFEELGFAGNTKDYYDPRNSCLNDVLTERVGIPITLSVVYIEIARRLGRPMRGVGLPSHFIVRYDDGAFSTFLDPFHGGRLLTTADCFALVREVSGTEMEFDARLLDPVGTRQILYRMINNLVNAYQARGAHAKSIQLLDLLVQANPDNAGLYRQRGIIHLQSERMSAARADLHSYLDLVPDAADRPQIEEQLRAIQRWLASVN